MKSRLALVTLVLIVGAIYFQKATKRQGKMITLSRQRAVYTLFHYGSLAEGFRKGQLSLSLEPAAELLALKDPYARSSRAKVPYVWDASLYKNKFYLYFSPVPVFLYHLPLSYVFNAYPDQAWALLLFLATFTTFLFLTLRELYGDRPGVPRYVWFFLVGLFAFGNGGIPALDYATWYVLACSCGAMWTAIALYCAARILKRGPTVGSCAAWAAATGLAFWSRPTHWLLFLVPFVFLGFVFARRASVTPKQLGAFTAVALLVLSAVGTYNYLRFDNPLDFGILYQLGVKEVAPAHTDRTLSDVVTIQKTAFPLFVFPLPTWDAEKKSLRLALLPRRPLPPAGNILETEPTIGLLAFCPIALLALLFVPALFHRELRKRNAVWFSAWLTGLGLLVLMFLANFGCVAARYQMDATPYFLIAATIQWFEWASVLPPRKRAVLNGVACALCSVSIAVGLLL